jgi:2,3-bisphosphoglycerate-independent phosphoglycerate mutase
MDRLRRNWPRTEISASGLDVGLPAGIMGNSEVGHQNIGAGRVVNQEIVRIDRAFESGELENSPVLGKIFSTVRRNGSKLHLMGLCSDGGVHSVLRHVIGLLAIAGRAHLPYVYLHAITDGRDTAAKSGLGYLEQLERACGEVGARIGTATGRFWAMDRDSRWERVERAYRCFVGEEGAERARSAKEALERYYAKPSAENRVGDEFLPPTQVLDEDGKFSGAIEGGDGLIFFNFRGDRPREIIKAFSAEDFPHFSRSKKFDLALATMCEYEKNLCPNVLFPKQPPMGNILGAYLSRLGLRQFRTAETEKYAHVTFFFNDYREEPFEGEERTLIASPRDVDTYDLAPAMSAGPVRDAVVNAIQSKKFDFCLVNFANTDMVGHTGNFAAAKEAVATVDGCIGDILSAADRTGMAVVVTADHGNADQMWDPINGVPHTQHTTNSVELLIHGAGLEGLRLREGGRLADIAPTLLQIMDIPCPEEMSGQNLIGQR